MGQAKESYLFLNGVESMLLGDIDKASRYLNAVIADNNIHAPSYYYLGRIAMLVGQPDVAYQMVGRAIDIDSANSAYLNLYTQILIARKSYVEAEALIARLRALDPTDQQNYLLGAALLLEIGKPDEARKLCEQFEQLFGLDERMVDLQRSAYLQTENYFTAELYMRRVVAAFPTDVDQLVSLADLNAALMRDSVALLFYDRAIGLDSTAIRPRMAKANYYIINKKYSDYINELLPIFANKELLAEKKIEIFNKDFFSPEPYRESFAAVRSLASTLLLCSPEDTAVRMTYGRYLTYSGQVEAAEQHYKVMVEQGINHPELHERLLQIYFFNKEYAQALALASSVYAAHPSSTMMEYRAIAAWLGEDSKLALSLTSEALRKYPADSVRSGFYALQGDIYQKIGQLKKCYAAYARSLRLNPDNASVLNNYAYHLSVEGQQLDLALQMAQKANRLSPDNPTFIDTEAWVLFKLGRYVDAQMLMQRVIALDPKPSPEVLLHYGDILYELGDDFLARNYWKRAAEAGATALEIESRVMRPKATRPAQ